VPRRTRQRREPTEDWQQLRLLAEWPEQEAYELIRPIVLFGQSPAERAKQTGTLFAPARHPLRYRGHGQPVRDNRASHRRAGPGPAGRPVAKILTKHYNVPDNYALLTRYGSDARAMSR